jgi:hypothetical protein
MKFSKIIFIISILTLFIGCASKPSTFVETHDEVGVWKSIQLHGNYGMFRNRNREVWRRVIDILSEKYDLEVLDRTSGYIRTSWKYLLDRDDSDKKYRSRVIIKMLGNIWHTAKLKTEAQWFDDGNDSWITGYDSVILEEIYKDVQGRIGTSIR